MDHVFGYTVHNDITSPTMREDDTFHYRAIHPSPTNPDGIEYRDTWVSYPGRYKGSDTFSPMGPWLVTKDERSEEHTSELQSLMRISYAVFCLKQKTYEHTKTHNIT